MTRATPILSASPSPAPLAGVDAVAWQTVSDFVDEMLRDWSGGDDCRMGFGLNGATVTKGQFRAVQKALAALTPAATPSEAMQVNYSDLICRLQAPIGFGGTTSEDSYEQYDSLRLEAAEAITALAKPSPAGGAVREAAQIVCEICKGPHDNDALSDICRQCEESAPWREALSSPATPEPDWRSDPTADERWNAGCDFAMTRLCAYLGVDPANVRWDAATETVEGDVSSVIGNIFTARFGEDWSPAPPEPALAGETVTLTRQQIDGLLRAAYPLATTSERAGVLQAALTPAPAGE